MLQRLTCSLIFVVRPQFRCAAPAGRAEGVANLQDRFLPEISKLAKSYFKNTPQFNLKVGKKVVSLATPKLLPVEVVEPASIKSHKNHSKLNGSLAFENFVTGKANQLAHAAAMQVANFPGTMYNPLFIYGGVGLGKTHLIQSIGNLVKKENPQAKICYVHATNYISDVVRAFQTKKFDVIQDKLPHLAKNWQHISSFPAAVAKDAVAK